jgi:hypothetical protein
MNIAKKIITAALLTMSGIALAGGDFKPKHGGIVQEVKEIHYELVAKPSEVIIYVEDHGKKVDTKGATAKVTFLNGSEKNEAILAPTGENKLEAKGTFNVKPGTKAVAVVTLAGKSAVTSRFVVQ